MVELLATNPAKLFGLYPRKGTIAVGSDADIVIFDPEKRVTISAADHHSRIDYNLYEGTEVVGSPETVLLRGNVLVDDGELVASPGIGRYVAAREVRRRSSRARAARCLAPRWNGSSLVITTVSTPLLARRRTVTAVSDTVLGMSVRRCRTPLSHVSPGRPRARRAASGSESRTDRASARSRVAVEQQVGLLAGEEAGTGDRRCREHGRPVEDGAEVSPRPRAGAAARVRPR